MNIDIKLAAFAAFAALAAAAPADQTKWIYKNPSTGANVGTLVDDSDPSRVLSDVRLTGNGATTIGVFNNKNAANLGHLDLSLPIESEDGATSYAISAFGSNAFQGNSSITRLTLPDTLATVPNECFKQCANLSRIDWGAGLTTLGSQCFANCTALACDIVLPDSVTSIAQPFRWTSIKSCTFGSGIEEIPNDCFYGISTLTNADWSAATSLRRIGSQAFRECSTLKTVSPLPGSLVDLGASAFYNCKVLEGDIEIPDSVTSTVNNPFRFTNIGSVKIGAGVTELSNDSFRGLSSLTNLDLSAAASLKKIGDNCFQDNKNMAFDFATLPRPVEYIGPNAFWQCQNAVGDVVLPPAVSAVSGVFRYSGITSFTAGQGLLAIANEAFCNCSSVTNLDLSPASSLVSIGSSAFKDLKAMVCDLSGDGLPRSLQSIGSQAFWYCSLVAGDVVLPDGVKEVANAFRGTGITSFVAGKGLETIGGSSFESNKALLHLDLAPAENLLAIPRARSRTAAASPTRSRFRRPSRPSATRRSGIARRWAERSSCRTPSSNSATPSEAARWISSPPARDSPTSSTRPSAEAPSADWTFPARRTSGTSASAPSRTAPPSPTISCCRKRDWRRSRLSPSTTARRWAAT